MTRRRWLLLAGGVLVLWLAWCGVVLLRASGDLREGRDAAELARDQLTAESVAEGTPIPALRKAHARFGSADDAVSSPVVAPLKVLPILGRQLRSVDALAGAAEEVTGAASEAVGQASTLLQDPATGPKARLRQVQLLDRVVAAADRRVRAVDDLGPRKGLLGPLADARNELAEDLAEAQETLADASAGSAAALRLLEGPRRYLVVAANNAEMRAGTGMWLSGGVLTTAGGRLDLGEVAPLYDVADVRDNVVPIADADLRDRWGDRHPEGDWRALMFSPRVPASAALGAEMWRASGQEPIDGMLIVDPVALAAVIKATGPIEVDGRRLAADQVVDELLKRQYERFDVKDERRSVLAVVAREAFAALDDGRWSPTVLASELGKAVAGRHLLAWSSDPVEQRGWEAAGMAGDLAPDSLLLSVLNRGGNKLDPYLKAEAELRTRPAGEGTEVTVRMRFTNEAPEGLPAYVAGPPFPFRWERGEYVGLVTLDVPGAATDVRFVEGEFPGNRGPDGAGYVVAAELRVRRGETRELEARFTLPGPARSLVVEPSARVPAIRWQHGSSSWKDSERRTAKW